MQLLTSALSKALDAHDLQDDAAYSFHCGEAGGIAAAASVFGVRALEMCDDISGAYEDTDLAFMRYILHAVSQRPSAPEEHRPRTRDANLSGLEFGAALGEATKAKAEGDLSRYSLMIGFTAGLMFHNREPDSGRLGTVLAQIVDGYQTQSDELLQQARRALATGARMTDPMPFMNQDQATRYYDEHARTMRWLQNFGLRNARSQDVAVAVPLYLSINRQRVQQSGETEHHSTQEDSAPPQHQAQDNGVAETAETWVAEGIRKGEQGDFDGAVADFGRAIELDPGYALAYLNRGNARSFQGNSEAAIIDFDRAVALDPGNAEAYYNRATARSSLGNHEGAIADYDRTIEIDPNHVSAYINRGTMNGIIGDYAGAIADFDRAIALDPGNAQAYSNRGTARSHLDDHEGAMADFNRAIELDPK